MKRTILFLTNAYPDFETSYRGIFIKKMAFQLKENGFKISVVTPKIYKGSPYSEDQNGITVCRFPFLAGDKLLIEYEKIPYLRMILYYMTGLIFTFYALLRGHCDLIHVHWAIPTGLIGVVAGKLLRKPMIVSVHGSDLRMAMTGSPLLRKIFIHVCRKAIHVHSVSEVMRGEMKELGIPEAKISTWPMGVDETFWQRGKSRKGRFSGDAVTVLSNRNLLPIYDVSSLIRAIPLVLEQEHRVRFLIAGEGSDRGNLEGEARSLKVEASTQFVGRVPHHEMAELLAQADIYVSTSLSDGTSVSLLEALASGAFPVVTDIPSNREWIVDGENGFLVPAGNEGRLASQIIEAVRNRELVERAQERNYEIAEKMACWTGNIQKIVKLYERSLRAV